MKTPALSFWERTSILDAYDFAIIGSGIVGLATAMTLKRRFTHARICIIDRWPYPLGASTRNAGFACFGSISELLSDIDQQGWDPTCALVERRWKGLQKLRSLVGDENLEYVRHGGYELFMPGDEQLYLKCRDALPQINRQLERIFNHRETFQEADAQIPALGFSGVSHLIYTPFEGALHPGKMIASMLHLAQSAGIVTLNGVRVTKIEERAQDVRISTQIGALRARFAGVATNGFTRDLLPELEIEPARNMIMVTRPIPGLTIQGCFHYDHGYVYFRNVHGRILIGGGRHLDPETEATDQFGENQVVRANLIRLLRKHILPAQRIEIDAEWSGILGLGPSKAPILKNVGKRIFVAVRLGGMGIAIGTELGESLAHTMAGAYQ